MVLTPLGNTPVVLKPSEHPFDFPPQLESPLWPSILGGGFLSVLYQLVRRNDLDVPFCLLLGVKFVAINGLFANHALGQINREAPIQRGVSVFSCGEALSIQTATGIPLRSANAMTLLPLPKSLLPTLETPYLPKRMPRPYPPRKSRYHHDPKDLGAAREPHAPSSPPSPIPEIAWGGSSTEEIDGVGLSSVFQFA